MVVVRVLVSWRLGGCGLTRVLNLCMCVDLSCGTVVIMAMVVSGLNQCRVKMS